MKTDNFRKFEELLSMESSVFDNIYNSDEDNEEYETFITSKELANNKEFIERINKDNNDGIIEESVHFKRHTQKRIHKYTESEMNKIRESCLSTIVHDYGDNDIYHISDEERNKNDMLNEISLKLCKLKRTYRKIDEYIIAMRIVYEAWSILERNNYIHSKEEFFELVAKGKIMSRRIIMPKMKGLDKYNLDTIISYISNPDLDVSYLAPKKSIDKYYDIYEDDEKESIERLLSPDEAERINYLSKNPNEIPKIEVKSFKRKIIKGYDHRNLSTKKNISKKIKREKASLAAILNKIQNSSYYKHNNFSYMVTHSLFDIEKDNNDIWNDLYFNGSWANDEEVAIYNLAVQEEILKQHPIREKYLTYADKSMEKFFSILEENGINTLELRRRLGETDSNINQKRERESKKENKKIEAATLSRILKLNSNSRFKKIVKKAENDLLEFREGE